MHNVRPTGFFFFSSRRRHTRYWRDWIRRVLFRSGALKLARLYTGKKKFISTVNSFHGKTMGSLSVTGRDLFRQPFLPLLETVFVPYGDAAAIEKAIDGNTAAVILEPIQGEGGVIVPSD